MDTFYFVGSLYSSALPFSSAFAGPWKVVEPDEIQYFIPWQVVISDGRKGEQEDMSEKKELDARGLICPMPIIKLSKVVKELQPGDVLEVVANDPGFESDISTWCEKMGHELLEVSSRGEDLVARIVKK